MLKIVIIEPDVKKQSQIRQTLEKELMPWLEPRTFSQTQVVSEVDFASSLEEYLGCPPDEVYHLENLSVDSFKADLKRNDLPDWIRLNTHFLGDKIEAAPDIVITKNDYDIDSLLLFNVPYLKKKGSADRYMFFQAADGDHARLFKKSCYLLYGTPVLTYLLTDDDSLQTLPNNKDGMCNYLPYSWKNHFPDNKTYVIVRMNAVLDNVGGLAENENLCLQYDKLDEQVVQNLKAVIAQLKGRWIYLCRDKWPEKNVRFTQELLALVEEVSCFSSELNQISISLSSKSSGELLGTLDLPCNQPSGIVQQSQTVENKDWQVVINFYAEQPIANASLAKLENAVAVWAQAEFEYCFRANKDLIDSINGALKGHAERLGKVIDSIRTDLEKSSLDEKFKEEHTTSLEYIKQKFDYIAGFTDYYGAGTESWHSRSVGSIVDELNRYQLVFQCLDDGKKINVHIDAADKELEVYLPKNGICCLTNIIEAVIRNTIKHEHHSKGVYDFRLNITKGGECRFYWEASEKSTTGMDIVRKSLNKSLVYNDVHIDNSSLGLKELRASMRYLYDGIRAFIVKDDPVLMYVDPNFAIVEMGNDGWGYRFNLRTYQSGKLSKYMLERMDKDIVRAANLVALSAIMARNFSHNIGSHALLSLISKVGYEINEVEDKIKKLSDDNKEQKDVLKNQEDVLNNLKTVYEYIRSKADFLSSFAFAGDGIVLHSESILDVHEEYKKYAYVFGKLAKGASGLNVSFCNGGETFYVENDLRISLPESGIFAFFNLMEILLWQSNFSEKDSWLYLQFLPQDTFMEVYMIWMHQALEHVELYQNREIQDVALYLQGIAPLYWREKRDQLGSCAFKLQKAKDFFFVVENDKKKVNGFDCESLDALQKKLQNGLVIPHEFLIFVDISDRKEGFLNTVPRNQLPFRFIDMKSEDIKMDQLGLLASVWKNYAEQHLFNERLLEPKEISDKEYGLIKINGKEAYSGNHGTGDDPRGRYYYNEGASSDVQKRSPLYKCTQSHELITEATRTKKRPAIWAEMDSSKQNKWICDKYAIFDYTTLPVVIIDERIQSYGSDEDLYEIWKKMNIYVPEKKLDTDADLDKVVEEYLEQVCGHLKNVGLKGEFCAVVFHESLLYGWVNKQENKVNSIVSYLQELKKKFPQIHVYLMTGRGKSQYVKQDKENLIRFVQFTPVYTACRKEGIDKLKMYNLLMSARK